MTKVEHAEGATENTTEDTPVGVTQQTSGRPPRLKPSFQTLLKKLMKNYLFAILGSAAVALLIRIFLIEAFLIPTDFMSPTLLSGDYIFVNKVFGQVSRGDVVVFTFPNEAKKEYIKRIIGIEGDRIEIRMKHVFLNGADISDEVKPDVLEEKLGVRHYRVQWTQANDDFRNMIRIHVPAGHVFVLGDNRAKGQDSRTWGFLPIAHIKGKAFLVWLSLEESAGFRFRWSRFFTRIN